MKKVKRVRNNWVKILGELDDPEMNKYFFHKLSILHRGKFISSNRAAYSTLKHFYSTTTIAELLEKISV